MEQTSRIVGVLQGHEADLLEQWLNELTSSASYRNDLISKTELREQSRRFLTLLRNGLEQDAALDPESPAWRPLREHLADVLQHWIQWGFKAADVAAFVLLLKRPLFTTQAARPGRTADDLVADVWAVSVALDKLALWTAEEFQRQLQDKIRRQQDELLELSTPVVELWQGVLALPLIGTLDSARTQVVLESLLEKIVETRADVAILDITGVPTVDTMVAQHLLKAVTAARLMGTSCIISGIRPSIAQTMVQLGVNLRDVTTKATLADAFAVALTRRGLRIDPDRHDTAF